MGSLQKKVHSRAHKDSSWENQVSFTAFTSCKPGFKNTRQIRAFLPLPSPPPALSLVEPDYLHGWFPSKGGSAFLTLISTSVCRKDLTQQAWNRYPYKGLAFPRKVGLWLMLGNLDFKSVATTLTKSGCLCPSCTKNGIYAECLLFFWEYGVLVCARQMST